MWHVWLFWIGGGRGEKADRLEGGPGGDRLVGGGGRLASSLEEKKRNKSCVCAFCRYQLGLYL